MPLSHFALMLMINVVWGLNLVVAKVAVNDMPPVLFVALRFVLLSVLLIPWLRWAPGKMSLVIGCALTMGVLHYTLIYLGLAAADDVATVAIAMQLVVPFSTVLSVVLLKETVGWRRTLGVATAFAGILILGFDPRVVHYLGALGYVVAGSLVAALGMVLMKRIGETNVFQLQAWLAFVSWPLLFALSGVLEHGQWAALANAGRPVWFALVFSAIGASLIGHGGMYWLLQRHDLSYIAPLTLLSSVFGVGFGVALLDDQLSLRMLVGGVVSLCGVLLITLRQPSRGPAPAIDQPGVPMPLSQVDARSDRRR